MKTLSRVLSVLVIAIMLATIAGNFVLAYNPGSLTPNTSNVSSVTTIGNQIIGIIQVVGSIAAVAVLVILGIKYMMGSTEEKAEYKKTLIPYIVGAVLVFASVNIAKLVFNWANSVGASN